MKIWLDDQHDVPTLSKRWPPDGYIGVKNLVELQELLRRRPSEVIGVMSFDHDLADFDKRDEEITGYDVIKWLAAATQYTRGKRFWPKEVAIHSANAVGATNIRVFAANFNRHVIERWEEWLIEEGDC